MSNNYLLIGLGGTGGQVLKSFRKALFEEFRQVNPVNSDGTAHVVHLRYLYVDSNQADLAASGTWRTQGDIGADISLDTASRFSINQNNLAERLKNPQFHPVTHRYIGNPDWWTDIFNTINVGAAAGGQMRRLGLSLFEPSCNQFIAQVGTLVNSLQGDSGRQGVNFHVCCGLAGGTGSGTFLQVAAQLRAKYPDPVNYRIYLYLLLPEDNSNRAANGNNTNYYANAYAALQELNAYLLSNQTPGDNLGSPLFTPFDLTGNTLRFERHGGEIHLPDPLQACFLLSNVNEAGHLLPIDEMPLLFSQLIYQRIFRIEALLKPAVNQAVFHENIVANDEHSALGNPLRSIGKCQVFGIKRIVVPEEEIREHFTARFAQQAALQMLYNNWDMTANEYSNAPKNVSFADFVLVEEKRALWKLSDAHLTLQTGILAAELGNQNWKKIPKDWNDFTVTIKKSVWEKKSTLGDDRLTELEQGFTKRYKEDFRTVGVAQFYATKKADIVRPHRHVEAVCDSVEHWLKTQWELGQYSAQELEVFLRDLLGYLNNLLNGIPNKLGKLTIRQNEITVLLMQNRETWDKVGVFGRYWGRSEETFRAQSEILCELYISQSMEQAWQFAQDFLVRIIAELQNVFLPQITAFRAQINHAVAIFGKITSEACPDSAGGSAQDRVIKFYQPAVMRHVCQTLLQYQDSQQQWAGSIRNNFLKGVFTERNNQLGGEKDFAAMVCYGAPLLNALLERESGNNAETAGINNAGHHNPFATTNIVAKIAAQYPNAEQLQNYVTTLIQSAQTFMTFRQVEFGGETGPLAVMAVILPTYPANNTFRQQLAQLFRNNTPVGVHCEIIDSSTRLNEITLISFKYKFPLRYLEPVHSLKGKYITRLSNSTRPGRAVLEIHTENAAKDLPSLLREPPDATRIMMYLQLASALNIFRTKVNLQTGEVERVLEVTNQQGLVEHYYYPDTLLSTLEAQSAPIQAKTEAEINRALGSISQHDVDILEKRVDTTLSGERYQLAQDRQALHETLCAQQNSMLVNCGNDPRNTVYKKFYSSLTGAIAKAK